MKKILIVGQTPPPYGGQAVMIERFLEGGRRGAYGEIELYHVRMAFSKKMGRMGKFGFGKLLHLCGVIGRIVYFRFRHGIRVLYYPPSGPVFNAVVRDMVILLSSRWLFDKVVFQFFAGGLSQIYDELPGWLRVPFRMSFFHPDVAIRPSVNSPDDGRFVEARRCHVVNWATEDGTGPGPAREDRDRPPPELLFVGVLKESKGIDVLLEACAAVADAGYEFRLNVMGDFESRAREEKLKSVVRELGLAECVRFLGVLSGPAYYREFARASVFCFPTYFESENVPLVTIDAAKFGLPIVATHWRGVPSVVENGVNGFLVPPRESPPVAESLCVLLADQELRADMGRESRRIFVERFTIQVFYDRMRRILEEV